jgi:hypothetical protein
VERSETDSTSTTPADSAPTGPTPTDSSPPADAREVLDQLEEKVGQIHPDGEGARLQGDFVRDVPGAAEPPD